MIDLMSMPYMGCAWMHPFTSPQDAQKKGQCFTLHFLNWCIGKRTKSFDTPLRIRLQFVIFWRTHGKETITRCGGRRDVVGRFD